jgi:hypothetical protein
MTRDRDRLIEPSGTYHPSPGYVNPDTAKGVAVLNANGVKVAITDEAPTHHVTIHTSRSKVQL